MRVLSIDIETSPNLVYTWGLWDQNVALKQVVSTSEVLCFAAKWQDAKRMMFHSVFKDGKEAMVLAAHELLDQADVVMHYNGAKFDIPHLNREFVEAGIGPPSPFMQIDLLQVMRRQFRFQSNKLEHVSKKLDLDGKLENGGFDLWLRCMAGDKAAWRLMEKYNRQDVVLLEELYTIVQPWIPAHPNRALIDGRPDSCPRCGDVRLISHGYRFTSTGRYRRFKCVGCGGYSRGRMSVGGGPTTVAA